MNSVVAILKTALSGAFFAAAVNPLIKDIKSIEMKGALRTLAGGTASRLGGGKFASGATSAAIGFLFNDVLHAERSNQDAVQKGQDCDRVCMNKIDGLTEQDVLASIEDGTGWSREYRDAWHNMGVEPGKNRKYTNTDGREAVFTTDEAGLSVPVTDHNGPTFNYGRNDFTHTILDVIPYFFEGAGPNDTSNFWARITVCTIGCSLESW